VSKDKAKRTPLFTTTIKDCEIQTFRSGGKGGQNQNKVESGVRIIHHPSGARGESREERSQLLNKRNAFRRMGESKEFKSWARNVALKMKGKKTLDDIVDEQMASRNLVVETMNEEGRWVQITKQETI
jgi:protein subunit release factor B